MDNKIGSEYFWLHQKERMIEIGGGMGLKDRFTSRESVNDERMQPAFRRGTSFRDHWEKRIKRFSS